MVKYKIKTTFKPILDLSLSYFVYIVVFYGLHS